MNEYNFIKTPNVIASLVIFHRLDDGRKLDLAIINYKGIE